MNELIDFLSTQDVEFKRSQRLSEYTSIGIGGGADLVIFPDGTEKLKKVINFLVDSKVKFKIVGNMTNILPSDKKISTVIISTKKMRAYAVGAGCVYSECGVNFSSLISVAAKNSLSGYERLVGIPGTVGAMISCNAGAYGAVASDRLTDVELYDKDERKTFVLNKDEISFRYRGSDISDKGYILLSARFLLSVKKKSEIYAEIAEIKKKRILSQPLDKRTLGSVFKRTEEFAASYLIDKCGLKGARVGDISVSEKHAGFFVNEGKGSAEDFLRLSEFVKSRVHDRYGVLLTEEFEYLE